MKLSEAQFEIIVESLETSLSMTSLKDDLLDHFCCFVEEKMSEGQSFEEAFDQAEMQICPNGLREIQNETTYLLYPNIKIMKKLIYGLGLMATVATLTGFLFKIMHWPGGNVLFIGGFLLLLLIFMPVLTMKKYRLSETSAARAQWMVGFISALLMGVATLFKVFHLMGANILLILGGATFILGFLPLYFRGLYLKSVG